jgi:hypothetical protein
VVEDPGNVDPDLYDDDYPEDFPSPEGIVHDIIVGVAVAGGVTGTISAVKLGYHSAKRAIRDRRLQKPERAAVEDGVKEIEENRRPRERIEVTVVIHVKPDEAEAILKRLREAGAEPAEISEDV